MQLSDLIIIQSYQYQQNINTFYDLKNKNIIFINCYNYINPDNLKKIHHIMLNNNVYFLEKSHYKKVYKHNPEILAKLSGDTKFGICLFSLNINKANLNIHDFVEFDIVNKCLKQIKHDADYLIGEFIGVVSKEIIQNNYFNSTPFIESEIFPIDIKLSDNDKEIFFEMEASDALHIINCFKESEFGDAFIIHNNNKIFISDAKLIKTYDFTLPKTAPSEYGVNVVTFAKDALKIKRAYFENKKCALNYFCSENFKLII